MIEGVLDNMALLCTRAIEHIQSGEDFQACEDVRAIKGGITICRQISGGGLPPERMAELAELLGYGLAY